MYERFTDRARKVMQLANQEAQRYNRQYIGAEHILMGMSAEGSGAAAVVLKDLGVSLGMIRVEADEIAVASPNTSRAKKTIEYAIEEARKLGHAYVGTEHLLLGLLREPDTVAAQVLQNLGFRLEDVRERVFDLLGIPPGLRDLECTPPTQDADIKHLPTYARSIVEEFDHLIDLIQRGKEDLVADHDFEKAAALLEFVRTLRDQRAEFINQWPKTSITEP